MNMQALMKQAQTLQKDMMKAKDEIDSTVFNGENALVKVEMNGKKELTVVTIDKTNHLEKEDLEMLEDMILLAVNDAIKKIDKKTEEKMGKFGNIPGGLF